MHIAQSICIKSRVQTYYLLWIILTRVYINFKYIFILTYGSRLAGRYMSNLVFVVKFFLTIVNIDVK